VEKEVFGEAWCWQIAAPGGVCLRSGLVFEYQTEGHNWRNFEGDSWDGRP